jgi:hypothetical protein
MRHHRRCRKKGLSSPQLLHPAGTQTAPPRPQLPNPQILLFNLPVNFAQGTSIFWAYVVGFHQMPLTAIQV